MMISRGSYNYTCIGQLLSDRVIDKSTEETRTRSRYFESNLDTHRSLSTEAHKNETDTPVAIMTGTIRGSGTYRLSFYMIINDITLKRRGNVKCSVAN